MPDIPTRWVEQAQYDFDTALSLMNSERYLYVLFCCQQAVEKMLKSIIVMKTNEFPPRIHNLERLAELADIKPGPAQTDFLGELNSYYIQSRYPEEIAGLAANINREIASETLGTTEEILQWLKSMSA